MLANPEKGRLLFEEAVNQLIGFADEWVNVPPAERVDHHVAEPLSELPG
jgi:hypothetical protein